MVNEFDLLVRGLHPWLVICYGLGFLLRLLGWGFMEEIILAQFTSKGVCRTWYMLWFAWFLFGLGYLPRCLVSLTLDLRLVRDCDHKFVLMYVMWEMAWLFLYLFPLLVVENLGEHWRLVMRVVLAGYWYMYCGCPWDYTNSLLWDVVSGLVIDLTLSFAVGASWYICERYFF